MKDKLDTALDIIDQMTYLKRNRVMILGKKKVYQN